MHRGINPHWRAISVLAGDLLVHVEKISIALFNDLLSQALDRIRKIQINAQAAWSNSAAVIASFLGRSRRNVARGQISIAGIFAFEEVVAVALWNLIGGAFVTFLFWHPNPAVIAQRL